MLRTTVWGSLCLVVVLTCVGGCGGEDTPASPSPAIMITSAGGRASLAIPAGALPPGVSAADLRITELAPADLPQDRNGSPGLGGVRLEPDGLVFNTPVTLTFTLPTSSISVPVLLLFNEQSVEVVPDVQIEAKPGEGLLTLSAEIAHFTVVAAVEGFFRVAIDEPGQEGLFGFHLVKETFNVQGAIVRTGKGQTIRFVVDPAAPPFSDPSITPFTVFIRQSPDAPWKLTGFFFTSGPVTPAGVILDRPPPTTTNNDSFSVIQPLTCESDGSYSVSYQAIISYDAEVTAEVPIGFPAIFGGTTSATVMERFTSDLKVSGAGGICFAPIPPEPPPLTPTPQPPLITILPLPEPLPPPVTPPPVGTEPAVQLDFPFGTHAVGERIALRRITGGRVAPPDVGCNAEHYHGSGVVIDQGTPNVQGPGDDPNPTGCGYGKIVQIPTQ